MGMSYAHDQERAARHLVNTLKEHDGRIRYSHFYDGTDEATQRLYAGMGVDADEAEWMGAEVVMDEAAAAMEAQGFVELVWLDGEKLFDGEPAYEIVLTDEGRRKLEAGQWPKFVDLDC